MENTKATLILQFTMSSIQYIVHWNFKHVLKSLKLMKCNQRPVTQLFIKALNVKTSITIKVQLICDTSIIRAII